MDRSLVDALAADLRSAGFGVDQLTTLWGAEADAALHRGHRVPAQRAIDASPGALSTLAQLFVLGVPVEPRDLDRALPSLGARGARSLGLTDERGTPLLDLRPYSIVDHVGVADWWIASDLGELALGHAIPEHHVLGVGGASATLSGMIVPRPCETALDLGTGCGIQALHLSRTAQRVVATDISERALRIAALNAALNGIDSIEFRLGSLFEPVAGERFDHIVTNPPFVITPRRSDVPAYEYRDGGMIGDALCATVIEHMGQYLTPGGIGQLLGNWEYGARSGLDRVAEWVDRSGLDAWVIERETQSVSEYAETWIRDGGTRPGAEFDRLSAAWLDDFAERGVDRVGFGYVCLRRPVTDRTVRRIEHYGHPLGGGLGETILDFFSASDWLARHDLETATLTAAPDVTEERHYWPGAADPTAIILRQGSGLARQVPTGTALAAVVGACDGELPIGIIVSAVAEILGVDREALLAEVSPGLAELVETGFLRP